MAASEADPESSPSAASALASDVTTSLVASEAVASEATASDVVASDVATREVAASVAWRLELDVPAEVSVARLRLVGAVVALTMGTVLAFGGGGSVAWTLIVLTWLVGLGWIGAYVVGRRKARRAHAWFVEARTDELVVALGREPTRVLWRDVGGVDADEDRLDVVVRHVGGELRLPSVWRGIDPHALADRIEAQRIEATSAQIAAEVVDGETRTEP